MTLIIHDYSMAPRTEPPVIAERTAPTTKAKRLLAALRRWNREGRELTEKTVRKERTGICNQCPHWNPKGNFLLGECRAPGCGCTRAKVWLASEKCPLKKWPR